MILVTVGTTMPFDELLAEVDRLADNKFFDEDILCQSGQSSYRMHNGTQFVGRPTLQDLIDEANLVITHGGATVIQLLLSNTSFVAVPNPRGAGDHQTSFLKEIEKVAPISWSSDVKDLARLIDERRQLGAAKVRTTFPRVVDIIQGHVNIT